MEKVGVIGAGRWGSFLAWYLAIHKHLNVLLYGMSESNTFQSLFNTRKNEYLSLPDNVILTSNIEKIIEMEYIIISIDAQNLKHLAKQLNGYNLKNKIFILAMKGIDVESKKRLTEIMNENINQDIKVTVLLGPGHVEDYTKGIPNCAVIDSDNEKAKEKAVQLMSSSLMRIYYGTDLIGNEIGGAYKNVIGIGAGILDGLGWGSLKGALMSRSIVEVGRFIEKMGGNAFSACGLSFLGDFEATLFSTHSNNRMFGELFIKGETIGKKNCEGYYTLKAVKEIGELFGIEMPITKTIYEIIYNKKPIKESLDWLFGRGLKREF